MSSGNEIFPICVSYKRGTPGPPCTQSNVGSCKYIYPFGVCTHLLLNYACGNQRQKMFSQWQGSEWAGLLTRQFMLLLKAIIESLQHVLKITYIHVSRVCPIPWGVAAVTCTKCFTTSIIFSVILNKKKHLSLRHVYRIKHLVPFV